MVDQLRTIAARAIALLAIAALALGAFPSSGRYPGFVPPPVNSTSANLFADFTTEGTSNHYWYLGKQYLGFSAWCGAVPGCAFTRASSATYINSSGVLATATSGVIRFDYDPIALIPKGLLLEQASTNLALQSNAFTTTWAPGGGTFTSGQAGIDGTTSAWKFTQDSSASTHGTAQGITLTAGITYTISVYAKAGTGTNGKYVGLYDATDTGDNVQCNVATGALVGAVGSGVVAAIAPGPVGFYRCSMTYTAGGSGSHTVTVVLFQGNGTSGSVGYSGDGSSNIFVTAAQVEANSFPSSYIATTTATVPRAADSLTATPISAWYNATNGVLYAAGSTGLAATNTGGITGFTDAGFTGANRSDLRLSGTGVMASVESGSGTSFLPVTTDTGQIGNVANVLSRAAMSMAANNFAYVKDGGAADTGSSGAMPLSQANFAIGEDAQTGTFLNGHVSQIGYWPTTATPAQLQALTAPPVFLPTAVGIQPSIFADFAGQNYVVNGYVMPSFAAFESETGVTFARASPATFTGSNGLLQTAVSGALRFDYDPVTLTPRGVLLEGASTNLLLHSGFDSINTNYSINAATATSAAATGPDGTTSAATVIPTATANLHGFNSSINTIAVTNGSTYTFSVYIKPVAAQQWVALFMDVTGSGSFSGNAWQYFDVVNGVTGNSGTIQSSSITKFSGGYFKLSLTATATGTFGAGPGIFTSNTNSSGLNNYLGNGRDGIAVYGGQFEGQTIASSYIATTTGTAARSEDNLSSAGVGLFVLGSPFTMYVDFTSYGISTNVNIVTLPFVLGDGTTNNYVEAGRIGTTGSMQAFAVNANTDTEIITGPTVAFSSEVKEANRAASANYAYAVNNSLFTINSGTNGAPPTVSLPNLRFGNFPGPDLPLWGDLKRAGVWPVAPSNAQLQSLTTQ